MKKKIIMVLCISVCLVMGGAFVSQNMASAYEHMCFVPYNIKAGSWNTGIHIVAYYSITETFLIRIFSGGPPAYREVTLDLADSPGGWTGTIENLVNLPESTSTGVKAPTALAPPSVTFLSPSRIWLYSNNGQFTVTQFITNAVTGFGFQTFYSWPFSMGWPYVDTTPLSEPFSKPMCGEGDGVDCD